ncbi:MAG: Fic family protein, partial [Phycisphaerae bacterium]|nr:Fic family protein [Phycisphaerae bacterium]
MNDTSPSRYRTAPGIEAEFQPGSRGRVLRNRLNICSKRRMDRAEFESLLTAQTAYLDQITSATVFTADLIRRMHRDWLRGIYEWAGEYRHVELEKGGFRWPPAFRVCQNMQMFESRLLAQHTPCRPAPIGEVARRIAEVHSELLLIHPFREGNGRLARWVADLMAFQARLPAPDYGLTGRGSRSRQNAYLEAVKAGYAENHVPLTDFFAVAFARRFREV